VVDEPPDSDAGGLSQPTKSGARTAGATDTRRSIRQPFIDNDLRTTDSKTPAAYSAGGIERNADKIVSSARTPGRTDA
jgi:hypothetical protein